MRNGRPAAITAAIVLIGVSVFGGSLSASAAGPLDPPTIVTPIDPTSDPDAQPQIEGTFTVTEPDLSVVVTVTDSDNVTTDYCTDAPASGTDWTCAGATPLPYGNLVFTAYAHYGPASANVADTAPSPPSNTVRYLHYGVSGPSALVSPTSGPDSTPTFSGKGPEFGLITVAVGGSPLCTATPDALGDWTCDSTVPLATGTYTADATAKDAGDTPRGTVSFDPFTVTAPNPPTVDQTYNPWTTSDSQPAIQGGKDPDVRRVVVSDGANVYCDIAGLPADATTWSCPAPNGSPLTLGDNTLGAVGYNSYGDSSGAPAGSTLITLVPQPTVDSPADNLVTNQTTITFSGTTPTGFNVGVHSEYEEGPLCTAEVTGTDWSCTASDVMDGTYNYWADFTPGHGVTSAARTLTIDTIAPDAPTLDGPTGTSTDRTPTFFGTGEPGAIVTLLVNGSPSPCASGTGSVSESGLWQCTTANSLDIDSYSVQAFQRDAATNVSALSNVALLTIALPPVTPKPSPTPKPPLVWSFSTGGKTEFLPGDEVDITSSGLPAGSTVDAVLHSLPVNLGTTIVKPDGTFAMHVIIPADTAPGAHHFVVTVTPPGESPSVVEVPATVKVAPVPAASPPKDRPADATHDAGGALGIDRDDPAAPSSLTHSIGTLGELLSTPAIVGAAAAAGLALLLLVAFPAELLNSTISEQYGRFARRLPKVRAHWLTRFTAWLQTTPLFGGIAITVLAAVIFGFADPGFGFDITSLRVVLACSIALFIVGYFASSVSGLILRRRWKLSTTMELKPLGLILAVIGVVMSRILDFSPGFMLGLILGISLVGTTTVAERAKATLVQAGVVFTLSVLGWVGYSILSATSAPDNFGTALAFDTMVAITAEGLTGLFIGMLPIRYLDGESVFAYSRPIWALTFLFSLVVFLFVVLPTSWGQVTGSIWLWTAVVGGFAVLALGIYLYFRFWAPPLPEDGEPEGGESQAPHLVSVGDNE